jgi:hypothetical protein
LFRGVAHAARVEQQDIARIFVGHDAIAPRTQHRRDSLAVALVHLTAIGLDMDAIHRRSGLR